MKANELMIADFVKYYDCNLEKECYAQVTSIQADGTEPFVQTSDSDVYYLAETYKPIPLTPEILEKNGFEVTKESKMLGLTIAACYELNNEAEYPNKYWIRIDDFSDDEEIRMSFDIQYPKKIHQLSGLDIAYVHELQHALRLCGLNDLADNFKI